MSALTPRDASAIVGLVDTFVRWREMNGPPRGYKIYHPSAFGSCLRMMQYQRYVDEGLINVEGEKFEGRMLRLFENGHVMHARWTKYFEQLGVLRGVWKCQNPMCRMMDDNGFMKTPEYSKDTPDPQEVFDELLYRCRNGLEKPRVFGKENKLGVFKPKSCNCGFDKFEYDEVLIEDKELNFRGHCDMILDFSKFDPSMFDKGETKGLTKFFDPEDLPKTPIVVDMKTIGVRQFESTVQKTGYMKKHGIQVTIYINVLGLEHGLLIYEQKDQFDLAVFKIYPNPGAWQHIQRQAMLMDEMARAERPLLPPPRPDNKTCFECKNCVFKQMCQKKGGIWDDPELEFKRNSFYGPLL